MPRTKLAKLGQNQRYTFTANYKRCGYKIFDRGYVNHVTPTLLLTNVRYNGKQVTDHLWFNYTKQFQRLGQLSPGNRIQFHARVNSYLKGYGPMYTKTLDYSLSYPTHVKLITKRKFIPLPLGNNNAMIGYVMKKNQAFYLNNDRPYDYNLVQTYSTWKKHYQAIAEKMKSEGKKASSKEINKHLEKKAKIERKRAKIHYQNQKKERDQSRKQNIIKIAHKHHIKILEMDDGIYNQGCFKCPKGHVFHTIPYFFVTSFYDTLCPICLHAKWHAENEKRRQERQRKRDAKKAKKHQQLMAKLNKFKHYCKQHHISYKGQWKFKGLNQHQRFKCPNGMLFVSTYKKIMNGYRYPLYKKYLNDAKFRHKCIYKTNGTKRTRKQRLQFESSARRKLCR